MATIDEQSSGGRQAGSMAGPDVLAMLGEWGDDPAQRMSTRAGPARPRWLDSAASGDRARSADSSSAARSSPWVVASTRRRLLSVIDRLSGVRWDPGRRGVAALAAVGMVVAAVAVIVALHDRPAAHAVPPLPPPHAAAVMSTPTSSSRSTPAPAMASGVPESSTAEVGTVVVSVVGQVRRAGLLHLPPGSRVADAIAGAGGATPEADLLSLNLAQRLTDGDQVRVGVAAGEQQGRVEAEAVSVVQSGGTAVAPGGRGRPQTQAKANLNTATEQELDALPGVGPVTAAAIVAWRRTNGRFRDVEQLGEIKGIGQAKLANLRELVTP